MTGITEVESPYIIRSIDVLSCRPVICGIQNKGSGIRKPFVAAITIGEVPQIIVVHVAHLAASAVETFRPRWMVVLFSTTWVGLGGSGQPPIVISLVDKVLGPGHSIMPGHPAISIITV